jgi:hypothetical protein
MSEMRIKLIKEGLEKLNPENIEIEDEGSFACWACWRKIRWSF